MAAFSSNIDITSGGTYAMDVTNGETSSKVATDLNGKFANIQELLQNGLPEVWTGSSLPDSLPNGKLIYNNNNLYQSNLLRLLTSTDYNTLNSNISNLKTQISNMENSAVQYYSRTVSYTHTTAFRDNQPSITLPNYNWIYIGFVLPPFTYTCNDSNPGSGNNFHITITFGDSETINNEQRVYNGKNTSDEIGTSILYLGNNYWQTMSFYEQFTHIFTGSRSSFRIRVNISSLYEDEIDGNISTPLIVNGIYIT